MADTTTTTPPADPEAAAAAAAEAAAAEKAAGRRGSASSETEDPSRRPPSPEEHPTDSFVCENSRCRYHGVKRVVRWQHIGAGLYLRGPVLCHCGWAPPKTRESRGTTKR